MSLSPAQSRAARGMLDWSQTELASHANLSESTVRDFEKGRRVPSINNLLALQHAFERAGLEFIPENGGGAGIRFRARTDGSKDEH